MKRFFISLFCIKLNQWHLSKNLCVASRRNTLKFHLKMFEIIKMNISIIYFVLKQVKSTCFSYLKIQWKNNICFYINMCWFLILFFSFCRCVNYSQLKQNKKKLIVRLFFRCFTVTFLFDQITTDKIVNYIQKKTYIRCERSAFLINNS